ncbi:MAG: hypothetical protein D3919_15170, partial [Candidatus Electrothrix sp. AW5]|nr:hypothetical protein [Candidatus Electrothrix gigas]
MSAINLDVVRVEACARGKGCVIASGPMQVDLLDMAKDNIDYVNQVLLPEKTKRLRLILGDNSTITVDGESFPLTVPSGKTTGLKLWGWRAFPEEGGFLSNLELKLNLKRQIIVRQKRVRRNWRDWNISNNWRENLKSQEINYSYTLKPILRVLSAKTAALSTEDAAAIVAMPDEDSEIMIGDTFSLSIPAGAVSEPMVISVEESKYTVEVLDEETGVVVEKPALSSNYELSPDGAEFDEPLQIVIPYHPDLLPSEVSEYDLAVYLDGEKIPTDINTVSKTATADVWHFSTANVSHSQATGNFVFPFDERDKKWQICQGYNTPTISHGSPKYPSLIHAFDFAYGTGNLGATGCLGNSGGSTNKTIIAPAEGMILWNGSNQKDITCFQLKVAVSNGHGAQIASVKFGHMKSNSDRRSANPKLVIAQKTPIGKLSAPDKFTNGGYAHIHMAAYTTANCTGVTVPFGTVFGSGYDFSSDGSKHQWHGTEIQANGSQSATCPNGDGLYCGSVVSRDANTLYRCTNGAYTVEEQCSNGCKSMPIGQDDKCEDVVVPPPATCPNGDGLYCGSVVSRDANTLYRCTNGVYTVE